MSALSSRLSTASSTISSTNELSTTARELSTLTNRILGSMPDVNSLPWSSLSVQSEAIEDMAGCYLNVKSRNDLPKDATTVARAALTPLSIVQLQLALAYSGCDMKLIPSSKESAIDELAKLLVDRSIQPVSKTAPAESDNISSKRSTTSSPEGIVSVVSVSPKAKKLK